MFLILCIPEKEIHLAFLSQLISMHPSASSHFSVINRLYLHINSNKAKKGLHHFSLLGGISPKSVCYLAQVFKIKPPQQ